MIITIPTRKGRRIIFESSRVNYLLWAMMHNLRLRWFPPKNIYTFRDDLIRNLPTHYEAIDIDDTIAYNIDGHCIAVWDKRRGRGIIELTWSKSYMELYYRLCTLKRMEL